MLRTMQSYFKKNEKSFTYLIQEGICADAAVD